MAARNAAAAVEGREVLGSFALGALLIGIATPAPAPAPPNAFKFEPIPAETALPVIGTTRARPVCTAIRRAVAPAVSAALKNDQTYGGMRKRIFDYVLKDSDDARDLHLMQMDREVDKMVKDVDALESALKSAALDVTPATGPEDAKALRSLRAAMADVLLAQKVQLNAMNGFVENERTRRFRKLDDSQQNMQSVLWPQAGRPSGASLETPPPFSVPARGGLRGARLLDRNLGDIAAFTTKYEDAASRVIIPAANDCK